MAISLSSGQLAGSAGAIFTATATTNIKTIVLFNSNTTTETIKLYLVPNSGGSVGTAAASNQILSIALITGETFEFSPAYPFVLSASNDTVQAESTTANKVNYWINGVN